MFRDKEVRMMSKSRCIVVVLALALAVFGLSAAGQRLVADRDLHDFGLVKDGDIVQCVFTLSNTATTDVTISRVSYHCGCTGYLFLLADGRTQPAPYTVPAGQSVQMRVTFRTAGYSSRSQPVSQVLTITSDDPTRPTFLVTIRATVLSSLPSYLASVATFASEHFLLVDLRSPEEYAQARLFGAINIPFAELEDHLPELPVTRNYIVYDHDGSVAVQAAATLRSRGYYGLTFVNGGFSRWISQLGGKFIDHVEGTGLPSMATTMIGGAYSQFPSAIAPGYLVVVDLSAEDVFSQARIPGSISLAERAVLTWAQDLARRLGLSTHGEITIWLLDDVGGTAAYAVAQQLTAAGFKAIAVQGGRGALLQATGNQLLWPVAQTD
jgi:rhodanese-related sulfurtransferase